MKLFCGCCQAERETEKLKDGTYHCSNCYGPVICTDCGAHYTDYCGPGSVYVPAVIERTYQDNMVEFLIIPIPPEKCDKPVGVVDKQGARCENAEGPEYRYMGKDYRHKCVLHRDHPDRIHYAFTVDGDGVQSWYRWGTRLA